MSRRREGRAPARPEVAVTCLGCGDGRIVATIHVDDEGDPVLTTKARTLERTRYSVVEDYGQHWAGESLTPVRPADERRWPRQITLICDRSHELLLNLGPLVERARVSSGRTTVAV